MNTLERIESRLDETSAAPGSMEQGSGKLKSDYCQVTLTDGKNLWTLTVAPGKGVNEALQTLHGKLATFMLQGK